MNPQNKPFFWGVASSGYQCEGGYNGPGQPRNNWGAAEDAGKVSRTGIATDFWNRFESDFALCRGLGLNAFRLSVEWARVQPTTSDHLSSPPDFDEKVLDAYADRIAASRNFGMEPVVTLHHFTHPAWLGLDAWLQDETPEYFAQFVEFSTARINARLAASHQQPPIHWFVTLNEPNMLVINTYLNRHFPGGKKAGLATGVKAYNRLLAAHTLAYNCLHDLYEKNSWPRPMVTMNTFCSDAYWSEKLLLDLLFVREKNISRDHLVPYLRNSAAHLRNALKEARIPFNPDPMMWLGRLVHWLVDVIAPGHATEKTFSFFLDVLERSPRSRVLDYLGLDYYDPFTAHLLRLPSFSDLEFETTNVTNHLMAGLSRKWWDWHALPEGLHFFCKYYAAEFPGLGVLVAENGMALRCKPDGSLRVPRRDKLTRSAFLEAHIAQIQRLRAEKVPMLGYLHWSLTDNYEWGSFTPRFGLFSIDFTRNAERHPIDHLGDCPSATYARLIHENRNPL